MSPNLMAAVEGCYRVFAEYGKSSDLDFAAQVGIREAERIRMKRDIMTSPLRTLTPELAFAYIDSIDAAHYDGGYRADEFRHFLPRALELIAAKAPGSGWALECIMRALSRANARQLWPAPEIEAVDRLVSLLDDDLLWGVSDIRACPPSVPQD